ncbi:unnamed protein product [Rotaria sordida]|uniref:Endonuclease/exonuclease/phosphatase domain-containing protein n=1 Tax=Rotaria sordida TaxID=392033 RepID=A0A819J912_9BILA|nr:unnamed protein product [Rotaria sordida]
MGVGIAVPGSMQLISTNFIDVGDRLRSTMEPHEKHCGLIAWCRDICEFILAGDFNFKPSEIPYRGMTEKGYLNNVQLPNSNQYKVSYQPNGKQILKSAYYEKNGTEPKYTNFAATSQNPNFCATLDYIFFAGNLCVNDVLNLPDNSTSESYPDETHPSDHLMIAASFRLL